MTKLSGLALLLFAANLTGPILADDQATDELVGSVPYYKRTFSLEPDAFLKALGLDRKAISPPTYYFSRRYEDETVGSGVLAPDGQDDPPAFSAALSKVQKAVDAFFNAKGVDFNTSNSPSNHILFIPQTGMLYIQGSLRHVLLVETILKKLNGVLRKQA